MAIDFARRPVLAGKNLKHPTNAKVRGDVRRSDADGTSTVPYFPLVSAGQTLTISTQGGNTTVTLSGNTLSGTLSDINIALGANGNAFSEDGCIGIQTSQTGDGGFISVTGGTASTGLGFNTYGGALPIAGRTSDVSVAPEGRVGNPYGTEFPGKEDLTSDVLNRNFGRLSANDDILWSDAVKNTAITKVVTHTPSPDGSYTVLSLTQKVLVAGQGLSAAATKKDLVPYFQVIDTATGLPAQSQVTAVVRGIPVGEPPYANSPSWADTTGKNVLGLDQTKVSASAITSIKNGRIVNCAGASFLTSNVAAGDWAEIASATNLSPSSNNGYRWVVERVLTETDLILRPMSAAELQYLSLSLGTTSVELNDNKTGGESYGNLIVRTGPFASRVNLVLRPAIPVGATYEVRAAVPSSLHDDAPSDRLFGASAALADIAAPYTPTINGVISGLDATLSVGNCQIATGLIRWHGRAYSLPTTTLLPAAFAVGTNYVYWDDATTAIKVTQTPADFTSVYNDSVAINKGHLLGTVVKTGAILTSVTSAKRRLAEAGREITVGIGGQFLTLDEAFAFLTAYNEGGTTASGPYPHATIVLLSDTTYSGAGVSSPSLTLRGATKAVKLTCSQPLLMTGCLDFTASDLSLAFTGTPSGFVKATVPAAYLNVRISNVTQVSGTSSYVVDCALTAFVGVVDIRNSSFTTTVGISTTDYMPSGGAITLADSLFTFSGVYATPCMFRDITETYWTGNSITISRCIFNGWKTTSSSIPLCANVGGPVVVEDSYFNLGVHLSSTQSVLFSVENSTRASFRNTHIFGPIPCAIKGNGKTTVDGCSAEVNPDENGPDGFAGINANKVLNSKVFSADTVSGAAGGWAVGIVSAVDPDTTNAGLVENNFIHGSFRYHLSVGSKAVVRANRFLATAATNSIPEAIITAGVADVVVTGNSIEMSVPTSSVTAITLAGGSSYCYVTDNTITMQQPTTGGVVLTGILAQGSDLSISQNKIRMTGAPAASNNVIGILADNCVRCIVSENDIELAATSGRSWTGLQMNAATYMKVASNILSVFGSPLANNAPSLTNSFEGNTFNALSDVLTSVSNLGGTVSNNVFSHTGAGVLSTTLSVGGTYSGNRFDAVLLTNNNQPIAFTGNTFVNSVTCSSGNSATFSFSGNVFIASVAFTSGAPARFDSCSFASTTSLSCSGLQVDNCKFDGAPTFTDNSSSTSLLSNSVFTGRLTLGALGSDQVVSGCKFNAGLTVSSAPHSFECVSNSFKSDGVTPALVFSVAVNQVIISANNFEILEGVAAVVGAIYFAGTTGNDFVITSNYFRYRPGTFTDPGGSGTVNIWMVSTNGTASQYLNVAFSNNLMTMLPYTQNFRGVALTLQYGFVFFKNVGAMTGYGNLMLRDVLGATPGSLPQSGTVIPYATSLGDISYI